MELDKKYLSWCWEQNHHKAGWLSELSEGLVLNDDEQSYLEKLDDDRRAVIKAIEVEWRKRYKGVDRGLIDAMRAEAPQWCRDRRKEYLEQEAQPIAVLICQAYADYAAQAAKDGPLVERLLILKCRDVKGLERRLERIKGELRVLIRPAVSESERRGVDQAKIKRARAHPLENLVEAVKGRIVCPLHDDRHPSMWVKGGFGYCFVCGGHLDAIGYMIKVRGLSFPEAVEALQ